MDRHRRRCRRCLGLQSKCRHILPKHPMWCNCHLHRWHLHRNCRHPRRYNPGLLHCRTHCLHQRLQHNRRCICLGHHSCQRTGQCRRRCRRCLHLQRSSRCILPMRQNFQHRSLHRRRCHRCLRLPHKYLRIHQARRLGCRRSHNLL